jgi:FkbM family methyltransferase
VAGFARDACDARSFVRLLRVRLAQSKLGPLAYRRPGTAQVRSRALGAVSLRSHTTDITVYDEIVRGRQYDDALNEAGEIRSIVDLGANIGLAARRFLSRHPSATIIAVEPDPANVELLRQNLAGFDATIVDACVGGHERTVSLVGDRADGLRMVDDPDGGQAVVTMPRILDLLASDRVDLLKVDVEGAEQEIFATCEAWIPRVRYLIVECHLPYDADALREAIVGVGADLASFSAGPRQFGYQIVAARLGA